MAAAQVSAAQAVGEYLQSPDDLAKVAAFRKKLEKEKASIDARLKSGVKEQLDATRQGLKKLLSTRKNMQSIKEEMITIDNMCSDPNNIVGTFDQISRVSVVHRNFEQTEDMVNSLLEMSAKVEVLERMVGADRGEIIGPATNLLQAHYQINRLEAFRNQTMHQAKSASAASRLKLTLIFEPLNKLTEEFEAYLLDLARNILPLVRAGYPDVVVKLIKVSEVEGREDEKAIAIRLVKKAAKMDAASKFKSMQANARVLKHYRQKIMKTIAESIKDKFTEAYERSSRHPIEFLDNLGWMYQGLIRIEEDVVPCFPLDYEAHKYYVQQYHKALDGMLQRLMASEPDASVLLQLHAWIKEYKKNTKELEIPPEFLEPPLLKGEEQNLIEDYVQLLIKKLDEWTSNLVRDEINTFASRSEPPEVDSDGLYGMQGAVILFQMVNQQVDAATESGQGAILARVVSEIGRVMRSIQERWVRIVETEYTKQADAKLPEEVTGGLAEYCIALANDQIKCADYSEALRARLEPLVSEKYRIPINERLNDAIDGNLDVARKCIQTFIVIIFNDLKPATKQLFQPPWYDGIMQQIIVTLGDYLSDMSFINPSLRESLVDYLLDAVLVSYITALANSPKLRMPAATDRIKQDIGEVFSFFSGFKPAKELEADLEVMELILGMLEASRSMTFLSYWSFAKVHGPNIPFVESLIKSRGDFDRSTVNEVMESIKRKVKDEDLKDPEEPTIMKKITVQGGISRFLRT